MVIRLYVYGGEETYSFMISVKIYFKRIANLWETCNGKETLFKGTVSWDRFQKIWPKFKELGLTKGRDWFWNFFRGSNDFIVQKVYLLR